MRIDAAGAAGAIVGASAGIDAAAVVMSGTSPTRDCPAHMEDRKVAVGFGPMWAWRQIALNAISDAAYMPVLPHPRVLR